MNNLSLFYNTKKGSNKMAVNYFTINKQDVPQPAEVTYQRYDLDSEDSFRSLSGEMQRDRITTKVKLDCRWNALNADQMKVLLKSMQDVFFEINYFDPLEGQHITKTFYVGDRSAPVYSIAGGKVIFKSFSANFIEK
jgi:hypothetical protein